MQSITLTTRIARIAVLSILFSGFAACTASQPLRGDMQAISGAHGVGAQPAVIDPAAILMAHNRYRKERGVTNLRWSSEIAALAQAWADRLAATNSIRHSESRYGENLWAGSAGAYSQTAMVDSWASEAELFLPGREFPKSCKGGGNRCGHYTQIIWRTTTQIGCGLARRSDQDYFVCQYDPPGNIRGRKP